MAKQEINIGSAPDDGTGDDARTAGQKINENFTELYEQDAAHTAAIEEAVRYAFGLT